VRFNFADVLRLLEAMVIRKDYDEALLEQFADMIVEMEEQRIQDLDDGVL